MITQVTQNATSAEVSSEPCQGVTELMLLKDTVSSLQASVLLLKQSIHASELCRNQKISHVR